MQTNYNCQIKLNHSGLAYIYNGLMSIGERIKAIRKKLDLSGEEFGEICGVTKGTVSQWETDFSTPPPNKLIKIREYVTEKYDIYFSLDWIYTGEIDQATAIKQELGVKEQNAWYSAGYALAGRPVDQTNTERRVPPTRPRLGADQTDRRMGSDHTGIFPSYKPSESAIHKPVATIKGRKK